jgi:hypothetical protein
MTGSNASPAIKRVSSGNPSPFTCTAPSSVKFGFNAKDKVALSFHDIGMRLIYLNIFIPLILSTVPIYDARKVRTDDFSEVLDRINEVPRLATDVPEGTCAVVAYTVNTYVKRDDTMKTVSLNIRWLMAMGLPGDSKSKN